MNLKFPIKQMVIEEDNEVKRFSHRAFERRMPKGVTPVDYDKENKLIELEFSDGTRKWECISTFFGIVIKEATYLELIFEDGLINTLKIVNIKVEKIKRTLYCKLIFELDLPF